MKNKNFKEGRVVNLRDAAKEEQDDNVVDLQKEDKDKEIKSKGQKLKMPKKKKILIIIIIAAVVSVAIWWYFAYGHDLFFGQKDEVPTADMDEPQGPMVESQLNGVMISREVANKRPFAIMIENHSDSRPHSGLGDADVVYEALAEGGITRFMALYQSELADEIGPVRSARAYYLDWAIEYEPIYTHAGGSELALKKILEYGLRDLNGIAAGSRFFWRDSGRVAPHNLYTSKEKLELAKRDEIDDWGEDKFPANVIQPWQYASGEASSNSEQKITINYSSLTYQVDWQYDPGTNVYKRSLAGEEHRDRRNDEQIEASTVVIQKTATELRDGQHLNIGTTGSGEGYLIKNGKAYEIRWEKDELTDRTKFYKKYSNDEMTLVPGQIWVEIVPLDKAIDISGTIE